MLRRELFAAVMFLASCKGGAKYDEEQAPRSVTVATEKTERAGNGIKLDDGKLGGKDRAQNDGDDRKNALDESRAAGVLGSTSLAQAQEMPAAGNGAFATMANAKKPAGVESAARAWFPETFLFEPLVVTNDAGEATVPVRVPDRLTTWRVLALAHSRSGAQGGAVTSFVGTLPTYVDPIVPPFLVTGDEVRVPVQLVNTTAAAVTEPLSITVDGASARAPSGSRTIPAQGSVVEYATLSATKAGAVKLRVGLGATDSVQRAFEVRPAGKPIVVARSGTLAAPRSLSIDGPAGADPATARVRLQVFPGALALLRSELGVSTLRGGLADDAYALLLAGRATALLASLGDKADPDAIRALSIIAAQRAVRDGRTLDVERASLLAEAVFAHAQNPILARLGERAADYLATHQRPDGTFAGGAGWSLSRVLVATADATLAVNASSGAGGDASRQRATTVRLRAASAFERNAAAITDAYTAAAVLASGAVPAPTAAVLRAVVTKAIARAPDGAAYLEPAADAERADGTRPTREEATALAVLALGASPTPADAKLLADLGTTLLGSYSVERGWGDGRTNLVAIRAVLALFATPPPPSVQITLAMDGAPVASGQFDRTQLRDVLVLSGAAPALAGTHTWTISAEPAVPGLGFSLALQAWTPWPVEAVHAGLELSLPTAVTASVGKPVTVAVTAVAPSGAPLHVQHALPAGVQVDTQSLQALVDAGTLTRFATADGTVDLYAPALAPGATFAATYRAIPTLAGTLHAGASLIEAGGASFHVPPSTWKID